MAVNRHNEPQLFMEPVTFRKNVFFQGTVGLRVLSSQYSDHGIAQGAVVAFTPSGLVAADFLTVDHADRVGGILINSTELVTAGELSMPDVWSFPAAGTPLFVGQNGAITWAAPNAGFQQRIGVATGGSSMVLTIGDAIILA
jgi:hypothetical protein